ncbi:restriction endonuclease subunit S [Nitrosomonas communis]|uniref:restriction endonuclease subunit S n=1 Tax=Nitrosomonas communis TaxID=44574 RepID=UPI003D2A3109
MSLITTTLGKLTKIQTGKLDANVSSEDGEYPFFTCAQKPLRIDSYSYDCECVLVAGNGDLNVKYYKGKFDAYQRTYIIEARSETQENLHIRYVYHFLESYLEKLREQSIGGIIKYIKLGNLTEAKIPLLPLAEQKRIAAILDAADALRTKRRKSLAQLDTLLQSTFLHMFGDPVTNPMGWRKSIIGDLVDNIDSGWSPSCLDRSANEGEWGVLKLGAVTLCEYRDDQSKALPDDIKPRPEIEVQKGDLLFTRKNTYDLVAACALVHETRPKLMLPDLIFRLRFPQNGGIEPSFVWQQLINARLRKKVQSLASGAAGSMPNISKSKLRGVELIIPPLSLQSHFATIVESIGKQKARLRTHLAELDVLFASLQARAFNGEL